MFRFRDMPKVNIVYRQTFEACTSSSLFMHACVVIIEALFVYGVCIINLFAKRKNLWAKVIFFPRIFKRYIAMPLRKKANYRVKFILGYVFFATMKSFETLMRNGEEKNNNNNIKQIFWYEYYELIYETR